MAFVRSGFPLRQVPHQVSPIRCSVDKPPPKAKRTLLSRNISILPVLVQTARFAWDRFWRLMMSELAPSDSEGRYIRPTSSIPRLPAPLNIDQDYAVYVGVACQWCHRVMLARVLLGLNNIRMCSLRPGDDGLWKLEDRSRLLRDEYLERDPSYVGRFTAPLLVEEPGGIVSNESADILRLLGNVGGKVWIDDYTCVWLRPHMENEELFDLDEMDEFCNTLYNGFNDGVYRCGFATSQKAYEEAQENLFQTLDIVEERLSKCRFLFSPNVVTEADIRLFPTAFRFDAVYAVLFKACRKSIRADYPAISDWIRGTYMNSIAPFRITRTLIPALTHLLLNSLPITADVYNLPGVPSTCDLIATRDNYYGSLFPLNPGGIVPVTPEQDLSPVPYRRNLGATSQPVLVR